MSISRITTTDTVDNWVEIATNTTTATTRTFSSIPTTYRKLMLRWHTIVPNTNTVDLYIYFNASKTANAYYSAGSNTYIEVDTSTVDTNSYLGYLVIDSAKTNSIKEFNGFHSYTVTGTQRELHGIYAATAAITEISFEMTSGTTSGTLVLYGTL